MDIHEGRSDLNRVSVAQRYLTSEPSVRLHTPNEVDKRVFEESMRHPELASRLSAIAERMGEDITRGMNREGAALMANIIIDIELGA